MSRLSTKVAIDDVIKALHVNGDTGQGPKHFIELVHMIEKLESSEQIVRARDVNAEHIGLRVTTRSGRTGILTDVEEPAKYGPAMRTAYHAQFSQNDDETFNDDDTAPMRPAQTVMLIVDGKIVRVGRNQLLVLRAMSA